MSGETMKTPGSSSGRGRRERWGSSPRGVARKLPDPLVGNGSRGGNSGSNPGPGPRDDGRTARTSATKWTARLGLAGVSAIAAVVSYFHALAVVQAAGATPPVAYLVPFLADLVILGASAALLDASRQCQPRPGLATLALGAGIAVTLAMNVAAGWNHGPTGALVAGWPAVAFILALESLAAILRRGRDSLRDREFPATASHPVPLSTGAALAALLESDSQRGLAAALGVPRSRVASWAAGVAGPVPEPPAGGVQQDATAGAGSPRPAPAVASNGQASHV